MLDNAWFATSLDTLLMVFLSALGIYVGIILYTRLVGLRSFSKMSGFDFAMTIAMGTVLSSTIITKDPPLVQGLFALGCLFLLQVVVAFGRSRWTWFQHIVDNEPILLMVGEEMLEDNMKHARITADDIRAKLREANVLDLRQVCCVVLETTGDVSVLHGDPASRADLDARVLKDVRDSDRCFAGQ